MSFRDLVLTVFLFGSVPFILRRPALGALLFAWVSIMNPHRLTWGFAYNMPFAQIIALATFVGMFFSREPKHLPVTSVTVTQFLFVFWMSLSTVLAIYPDYSTDQWIKVIKIQLMVFVTLYLLHSKQHVQWLIWVVAGSVASYGTKGGVFTITGGGEQRVYGPEGFIAENNALALAVIMTIPLLRFIQLQAKQLWLRWGLLGSMVLCGFSALGSQSRGALIAIVAMLLFLWVKSRNKVRTGLLLVLLVPFAIAFMPEKWEKRMQTIETYEEDSSAQGRINAWMMAFNLAKDRPLVGGGFEIYEKGVFARYAPNPDAVHAAHSIYFQVLGEHGFVGLGLYLLLGIIGWRNASWIRQHTKDNEEWRWANDLASMIQVSMVGFATGGTFLSLAYFDVPYYLLAAVVLTRVMVEKELGKADRKGTRFVAQPLKGRPAGERPAVPAPRFKPPAGADGRG